MLLPWLARCFDVVDFLKQTGDVGDGEANRGAVWQRGVYEQPRQGKQEEGELAPLNLVSSPINNPAVRRC